MIRYIVKRILQSILTLFIIVSVVFLLMRLMPTDYFFTEDELIKLTDQQKLDKLEAAGLLDNPFVQLKDFYTRMFKIEYTWDDEQTAALSANLAVGAVDGLHTAVENTIKEFYTDADAAQKEISKMNDKVLTEKVILKITGDALNIETDDVIEYVCSSCSKKALDTMFKDVKKVCGDENAAKFSERFEENVRSEIKGRLADAGLTTEVTGLQNVLNHINPLNYKLIFDLGKSYRIQHGVPVTQVIMEKFPISMSLGLFSLAIALVLGVVVGILQARFKGGLIDNAGTAYTIFVNAVPQLVSYTLIMYACTKWFGLPMTYRAADPVASAIPPILCLAMASTASYMLWMRRYMVDELNKDYIRLAQLKGFSTTQVMFRHVMKNAFLPLAQYLPYNILLTVGGSLLAESFFSVPGMGPLLTLAISRYDTNLVQAIVLFYGLMGITGTFLGDLLMGILDPRISLTKKGGTR